MRAREPFPGRAVLGALALALALFVCSPVLAQTDCSQLSPDRTTTVEVRILSPEADGLVVRGPYSPCTIPVSGLASAVAIAGMRQMGPILKGVFG